MFQYIKAGRCFGPISAVDLVQLLESGVLSADDLVRVEGVTAWSPAQQVVDDLRAGRLSEPALGAAGRRRSVVPVGAHTVMTSSPPLPANPLPRVGGRHCRKCGIEMRADARYCKQCGDPLAPPVCAACGRTNDPDAIYCDGCGQELAD